MSSEPRRSPRGARRGCFQPLSGPHSRSRTNIVSHDVASLYYMICIWYCIVLYMIISCYVILYGPNSRNRTNDNNNHTVIKTIDSTVVAVVIVVTIVIIMIIIIMIIVMIVEAAPAGRGGLNSGRGQRRLLVK